MRRTHPQEGMFQDKELSEMVEHVCFAKGVLIHIHLSPILGPRTFLQNNPKQSPQQDMLMQNAKSLYILRCTGVFAPGSAVP